MKRNNNFIHVNLELEEALLNGQKLLDEEVTGLIIDNFLSHEECQNIVKTFMQISIEEKTIVNNGFQTLPLSFAQFTQLKEAGKMNDEDYTTISTKFRNSIVPLFGVNIEQKLKDCFKAIFPNKIFNLLYNPTLEKHLVPFNFRELKPGNGELVVHCENLFFKEFPSFFEWLSKHGVKNNQFSFFITLQNTEEGGELKCYDFLWENVKERVDFELLKDESGKLINVNDPNVGSSLIKPSVGTLLLFNGGNIWHKVEKVIGNSSRVTVGGFVSSSKLNSNEMFIWA